MTGMEHAIEQAARVLAAHRLGRAEGGVAVGAWVDCSCGTRVDGASRDHAQVLADRHVARALAEAGLIAPAPLREEWGIRWDDNPSDDDVWEPYLSRQEAEVAAGDEGTPVHRWATEWKEA